ncbi:hypothetical protein U879_16800 [Defluviimonas sp. 20V17]|uniref:Glycosyltransferase involved in LPS biosynthesis, GR25 family n=1 Tax=Allgaiera indica TaxID=765699 RepID=A0AAN4UR57_9RHOB|nr:glycosyltransferase family 25 protein [Allgaiera indica]KDB02517.1 hypothetical protein U879_16800 [Defluviimonas sp. 20V17]GHE01934.1 hypothetical protein GCM10008024_19520 [Allgaiera indica]SDX02061.1 Glycosyltransferase involved in LPS biosynthesis, GR25 family [Allgaiera indica]
MRLMGLVIHLPRATARRPVAEALRAACGVPCDLLEACDGAALPAEALAAAYRPDLLRPRYPFALRAAEIGCFLSHRAAWQRLIDSDAEALALFEDDMVLDPAAFAPALTLAQRHVARMGYVQFQTRPVAGDPVDAEGSARLFRPTITPLRASGQLIHRDCAHRLLDLTAPFDRPIDTFVQMHWHTGLRPGAIHPAGLRDVAATAGGSTISQRKSLADRLAREWKRGRYRAAVRRLSEAAR